MGGPTFNFSGELEILGRPAGDSLRKTVFEDQNLTQYWLDNKELRLLVYHERQVENAHGYVELAILTKASEEGVYDGRYLLSIHGVTADAEKDGKQAELTGKVSCGAE
ncbi:hypothetical protein [Mesorhizobium sp. M0296]